MPLSGLWLAIFAVIRNVREAFLVKGPGKELDCQSV